MTSDACSLLPGSLAAGAVCTAKAAVNVPEHHNHDSRDGLYVDPAFTPAAAAALNRDLAFDGSISGNVYAQPLYIEGGPGGRAMIIAVTESNNVYALDAADGSVIWQRNVGPPVPLANLPCGDIDPLGITGTPVVDLPSRTLLFDAMTTPDNGTTMKHLIYSMNVDTGTTNSGWPVDVNATATSGSTGLHLSTRRTSGARWRSWAATSMCPTAATAGDCGTYYGWLVGVPLNNPANVMAWATAGARRGRVGRRRRRQRRRQPVHRHRQHLRGDRVERRRGDHPLPARPGLQRPDQRLLGAHQLDGARYQRHRSRRLGRVDR